MKKYILENKNFFEMIFLEEIWIEVYNDNKTLKDQVYLILR